MYWFSILLPLLLLLFYKTVVIVPAITYRPTMPDTKSRFHAHRYSSFMLLVLHTSVISFPVIIVLLPLMRLLATRMLAIFTNSFIISYIIASLIATNLMLIYIYAIFSFSYSWKKEYLLVQTCVIEFLFTIGMLIIGNHFFTYEEYFLYPIIRLILTQTLSLCFCVTTHTAKILYMAFYGILVLLGGVAAYFSVLAHITITLIIAIVIVILYAIIFFTYLTHNTYRKNIYRQNTQHMQMS